MNFQSNICIIGNGAIGKTAALGFSQAGASVTLVDAHMTAPGPGLAKRDPAVVEGPGVSSMSPAASAHDDWDLRVYALNPLAQALLTRLKVWDALDATRVTAIDAMRVFGDDPGGQAAMVGFDAYAARVGALAWIVEDANLNQALDTALKFAANVRLVKATAHSMTASDSATILTLADGGSVHAELLVGADGANSWVRGQAGIDLDYRSYGQQAIVAGFTAAQPHRGIAYQWFSASEGIVALLPLAGDRVSLVWSAPQELADILAVEPAEALAARVSVFCLDTLGILAPLGSGRSRAIPLAMIRPHAITSARMALVGDAAHVVHPLAGHGMNLGFADVDTLLRVVDERGMHRDRGDARVLSRYARERREDILLMQLATDGLQRLFASDLEPLRIVRNIGMNLVNGLPGLKRKLIAHAMGTK